MRLDTSNIVTSLWQISRIGSYDLFASLVQLNYDRVFSKLKEKKSKTNGRKEKQHAELFVQAPMLDLVELANSGEMVDVQIFDDRVHQPGVEDSANPSHPLFLFSLRRAALLLLASPPCSQ